MEVDDLYNPMAFASAAFGFFIGVLMLKFGGLTGMGILGQLGMIGGATIGGFIAGIVFFKD